MSAGCLGVADVQTAWINDFLSSTFIPLFTGCCDTHDIGYCSAGANGYVMHRHGGELAVFTACAMRAIDYPYRQLRTPSGSQLSRYTSKLATHKAVHTGFVPKKQCSASRVCGGHGTDTCNNAVAEDESHIESYLKYAFALTKINNFGLAKQR